MSLITQEFEANKIINDKIYNGQSYYLVEWKNTITDSLELYKDWKNDIKNIVKTKNNKFIIIWKESWILYKNLNKCDEILGAYLLLKLYNYK